MLIKGPGVMEGYHNQPEQTAETLTEDGWLHTGDIGELDADGYLRITDRKKDLFKTSGGKYIAPSAIESQFKAICPYAGQFLVHGAERNYCVALITLDPEAMDGLGRRERHGRHVVRRAGRLAGRSQRDGRRLRRDAQRAAEPLGDDQEVDRCSTTTSPSSPGELTPSMKVKRKVVEDNHRRRHRAASTPDPAVRPPAIADVSATMDPDGGS